MNVLEIYFDHHCIKPDAQIIALNELNEHQIISDCVIEPRDVAPVDAMNAVKWLRMKSRISMDVTGRYARIAPESSITKP